jgi:hypothetical protein
MEKKYDLITNCMHSTYTGRLLMQDMLLRQCAGVEGVTMPETYSYSIQKRGVLFSFGVHLQSEIRYFAPRCYFGL